jgi:hypothetical protein
VLPFAQPCVLVLQLQLACLLDLGPSRCAFSRGHAAKRSSTTEQGDPTRPRLAATQPSPCSGGQAAGRRGAASQYKNHHYKVYE